MEEARLWSELLMARRREAALVARPLAGTWSPLEYAGHVRDVLILFAGRIRLALETNEPTFSYKNQDEAIEEGHYNDADPNVIAEEILVEAAELRQIFDRLESDDWHRWGTRHDDERFDVSLLARFTLHEIRHHRVDAEQLLVG
jgi:DinB superfamily